MSVSLCCVHSRPSPLSTASKWASSINPCHTLEPTIVRRLQPARPPASRRGRLPWSARKPMGTSAMAYSTCSKEGGMWPGHTAAHGGKLTGRRSACSRCSTSKSCQLTVRTCLQLCRCLRVTEQRPGQVARLSRAPTPSILQAAGLTPTHSTLKAAGPNPTHSTLKAAGLTV